MKNNYYQEQLYDLQRELENCEDATTKKHILGLLIFTAFNRDNEDLLKYIKKLEKSYDNNPKDHYYFRSQTTLLSTLVATGNFVEAYNISNNLLDYIASQHNFSFSYYFNLASTFLEAYTWTRNREIIWQYIFYLEKALTLLNQQIEATIDNKYKTGLIKNKTYIYYLMSKGYFALDKPVIANSYNQLSLWSIIATENKTIEEAKNHHYTDLECLFKKEMYTETITLATKILDTKLVIMDLQIGFFEYKSRLPETFAAQCTAHIYIAKSFSKLNNHTEAIKHAESALQVYNQEKLEIYYTLRECLETLHQVYSKAKDYEKAYHFLIRYNAHIEKYAHDLNYYGSLFLHNLQKKHSLIGVGKDDLLDWDIVGNLSTKAKADAEKVCCLVQQNFSNPLYGAEQLAADLSITEKTLERKTKKYFDKTPAKMIVNYRLSMAKFMLRQKIWTVSQVATYVGFSNISYFSQTFKKYVGQSPTNYLGQF